MPDVKSRQLLPKPSTTTNDRLPCQRILVIRYRFIGDTILTIPFLHNLRLAYPNATIDVLVGPQSGKVLEGCPDINNLIIYDTTRFHKYDRSNQKPRNFWSYAAELRQRKYDTVFVLKRSFGANLLALLTGAKYRIGYSTQLNGLLLTHHVRWSAHEHEVESLLSILGRVGLPCPDKHIDMWISNQEIQHLQQIVPQLKEVSLPVLFHAAAAHPDKMLPLTTWAQVINSLSQTVKLTPFFSGAAHDYALYEKLIELSNLPGINLAGKLSLRESLVLYSQMKLAVCVDSGPAHLAAAVGTPTIAIFGPTDPVRWKPWGQHGIAIYDQSLSCRPCNYHKTCHNRPCLTKLPAQRIVDECLPILRPK